MTAHDKVLDKLQKIKGMADSAKAIGSEAEAQAFAEMLQRMLLSHKLEMSDIEFERLEREDPVIQRAIVYPPNPEAHRNYGNNRKTRVLWMERLASVIARAHFCRIITWSNTTRLSLAGRPDDIAVAEYMIVTLQRAADKLGHLAKCEYRDEMKRRTGSTDAARGFRESWVLAFTGRLSERYLAERTTQEGSSSIALVRLRKEDRAVDDFLKAKLASKEHKLTKAPKARGSHNHEGAKRGKEAADKVDLRANAVKSGNAVRSVE